MGRPTRYTQHSGGAMVPFRPSSKDAKEDSVVPGSKSSLLHKPEEGHQRNAEKGSTGNGRKYDLPTLMNIGSRVDTKNHPQKAELRRETSEGSVGRGRNRSSSGSVLGERAMNRRKQTSSTSDSLEGEFQPSKASNFQYPIRQPINAPQGVLAQSDAGFAKFLKQHSSPKHHRVTAGGRIVQMEMRNTPAPQFKLSNKKQDRPDYSKKGDAFEESLAPQSPMNKEVETGRQDTNNGGNSSFESNFLNSDSLHTPVFVKSNASRTNKHQEARLPQFSTSGVGGRKGHTELPQGQGTQQQLSAKACPFTPSTTATENRNEPESSIGQESYSQHSIPQYMTEAGSLPIQSVYPTALNNTLGIYPPQTVPTEMFQYYPVNNSFDLPWINHTQIFPAGVQPPAGGYHNLTGNKTLEEASQEYDDVSARLSNLDKYMALHTWEIDAQSKKVLVEQRIDLVQRLDAARIVKEHLESMQQATRRNALCEAQSTEQASQHSQSISPSGQGAVYIPGNGMIAGGFMSPGMGFQQPHSSESMFTSPIGGPQYGNLGLSNITHRSNHRQAPIDTPNAGLDMAINKTHGGFVDGLEGNKRDPVVGNRRDMDRVEHTTPPRISSVYREIEEAVNRGVSIDPYLKELARVVAQLEISAPANNDNNNTVTIQQLHRQQQLKKEQETAVSRQSTMSPLNQQNPHFRTPAQLRLEILQGDRYRKDFSTSHGNMTRHENMDPNQGGDSPGRAGPAQSDGAGLVEPNLVEDGQAKVEEPEQRGSFFSALSFAPWRKKWSGNAAQKVGTSTQAQRINVHGTPTSFDGHSDGTGKKKHSSVQSKDQGYSKDGSRAGASGTSKQSNLGLFKTQREEHNLMDVRGFFQELREEDKQMLEKYRGSANHRPFK